MWIIESDKESCRKALINDRKSEDSTWFGDSCRTYGYAPKSDIASMIEDNFEAAYSNFSSLYPMVYVSSISPLYRVAKSDILYNKIFMDKNILYNEFTKIFSEKYIDYIEYSEFLFISKLDHSSKI